MEQKELSIEQRLQEIINLNKAIEALAPIVNTLTQGQKEELMQQIQEKRESLGL